MSEITTIWLDLAKHVFQLHGADASGRAVLRKKLRRDQVLAFFSLSCCRFDGHEDKIVTKELECRYDETEVQP